MDTFSNDLNSSMMFKGQHPEYTLIVSLESSHSEFDSFWENPSILGYISNKTIVLRLSQDENSNDIQSFESIFHSSSIPSLFIFGSNQATISHSWNDHFPSISEFSHHFDEKKESTEFDSVNHIEQITPETISDKTPDDSNDDTSKTTNNLESQILPSTNQTSTSNSTQSINQNHTPLNPPSSTKTLIQRPPPRSQPQQKSQLITSTSNRPTTTSTTQKVRNTARICVQGNTKTVNKVFPPGSTIGDLRNWIQSEFGRSLDLIVVHTHTPLPTDPSTTLAQADLCPSAVIRERDGGDATLRDDEQLSIGIVAQNEQPRRQTEALGTIYEDENAVTNSPASSGSSFGAQTSRNRRAPNMNNNDFGGFGGSGGFATVLRYLRLFVRIINPWADDEEDVENEEDMEFERRLWEFRPNPSYAGGMLSQMDQNARQNVQQEDSWHPSRF